MTLCVISQWEQVTWQCSSYAGLLDPYPALVLYLAGDALHQQPMDSRSHDCSSYVGCGGIPCSTLVSPNASLHKWQQAVAPGWPPYMVPESGFRPAHRSHGWVTWYIKVALANGLILKDVSPSHMVLLVMWQTVVLDTITLLGAAAVMCLNLHNLCVWICLRLALHTIQPHWDSMF